MLSSIRSPLIRLGAAALLGAGLLAPPAGRVEAAAVVALDPAGTRTAMLAAGQPYARWAAAGRRFVLFDPAGDGRAAEVVGDLATADRIVVLIPGVATDLANFDRGLGGVARRAPAVQARAVAGAAARVAARAAGGRVAVVAWLGYDPPDGLGLAAARADAAAEGAARLVPFVAALLALRPAATVTIVGHSYGAAVIGRAADRLDARVTDLVALGAPGMGVGHARDLRTAARVWAAEAPTDWIRRVPGVRLLGFGHGRRPADGGFGARRLPTAGVDGHDGYLAPGSATLAAVGLIAAGRGAEVPA
jgi:pimeloyl-ACP methyl ester carboxylesterase